MPVPGRRDRLVIATRASALALWQARHVRDVLRAAAPRLTVELREITTTGDRTAQPLAALGGKGLFLKEIEQALLDGGADLAVHSVKDMPAELPPGLVLAAVCARGDPRDAFVSNRFTAIAELPPGALIGTCALRRQSQLRARWPHLRFAPLRGNVGTRLAKLDAGGPGPGPNQLDAVILAVAGLRRLGMEHRIREILPPDLCLPAAGQGAIGLECRAGDARVLNWTAAADHADTKLCVAAERAVTAGLGGDCHAPLAAFAELRGGDITVSAWVGSPDGARSLRGTRTGARTEAGALGRALADDLLARGAANILADA